MRRRDYKGRKDTKKQRARFDDKGEGIVIDFFPQGKSLSRKRAEDYNPLAVVVTTNGFQFFDVILANNTKYSLRDTLTITFSNRKILQLNQIQYDQLSSSALKIIPEIIKQVVLKKESHYVAFLNQAHPLTTRMHQLQLLPGVGQKRMWAILEARKRALFVNFKDFTKRTGVSDPSSLFSNRIITELEEPPKYRLFTKIR
ncbi:MAG: DUF655 domain-containing protein [Candidatus Hodarchaeales archaeon]|jgi:putative nucleotide binding protein